MADQEPQETLSLASTFPNPPPFWKDFTPDRVARIEDLRRARAEDTNDGAGADAALVRLPDLPEELANLQPPPEPADGRWRVFGDQYMLDDKLPTLEEQGITNLPATGPSPSKDAKHYNRALELKKLAKSLLLNFLELAGTLSRSPAAAAAKTQDLRTLFINVHHILNEYRPHQARESAIELMQDHLDRTRAETVAIRTQVDKARRVLEGLGSLGLAPSWPAGADADARLGKGGAEGTRLAGERDAEVWTATDAAFA
ncbi:Mediator of RNA polymerase II transcription subunit 7 [Tolypocladium ophioglossoides CBS 100239]|uniref:Mediator of RNA polymerase II transcription subunit 7 n=1 Tax=Tolypocladium ophioglossoides (strain CBS 100239) TaxID=1163406 RepID=A0A0L0NG87_TOLOC|nr:Mediator of RNA polymerase II transcription subunit 7 [Tolypocladium ophioglossoides CBS 100239]